MYVLWGLFPLFWPLLKPAGALEILAHRLVWSAVLVALVMIITRASWRWVPMVFTRKNFFVLGAAAGLLAINWLTYIFAVNAGHVIEGSLGYFINPLVSVLLGVWLFGERLGRTGRIGSLLAFAGVVVIAWSSWQTLWISLLLAFSFGFYGATKKRSPLPALPGLLVESGFLFLPALGYLLFLAWQGTGQFGTSTQASLLLMASGAVTAIPLWLFAIAAPKLPLGLIGILQYLAPTIQLLLGVFVFGQVVSPSYWAGMVLVWVGCAVFLSGALRTGKAVAEPE